MAKTINHKVGKGIKLGKTKPASRPLITEKAIRCYSLSMQEYLAEIEKDKARYAHDWNDSAAEWFRGIREG